MTEQVQWPSLPETPYPEHQKAYEKSPFEAKLAGAKARKQIIDDIDKAKDQAEVDAVKVGGRPP